MKFTKPQQRLTAYGSGIVFVFLLIGLAVWIPNPTDFQYTVFRIVLALAAAGFGASLPGFLNVQVHSTIRAGGALAVFIVVYFFTPAQLVRTQPPKGDKQQSEQKKTPATLRELFDKEFDQTLKMTEERAVTFKNGSEVKIQTRLYMDHDARSMFLAFFIPSFPATYEICAYLADNYQPTLDQRTQTSVTSKNPGEPLPTSSGDLRFTGRVYLYHEDEMSLDQLAKLTELYKSRNLGVQFRGPDYLITKFIQQQAK